MDDKQILWIDKTTLITVLKPGVTKMAGDAIDQCRTSLSMKNRASAGIAIMSTCMEKLQAIEKMEQEIARVEARFAEDGA